VDVAFIPPSSKQTERKNTDVAKLKVEIQKTLVVHFATGQTQDIYLRGIVLRPLLVAAPAEYRYLRLGGYLSPRYPALFIAR